MKWGWARSALAAGLVVPLFGCTYGPGAEPMPQPAQYICENGKAFAVEFLADPPSARIVVGGSQITLPQTVAATDAKYTDGRNTLYIEGDRALLETAGQVFGRGCIRR
ncbi:MAG: MliC family protein [Candidatus Methylomirabilota bacterium]